MTLKILRYGTVIFMAWLLMLIATIPRNEVALVEELIRPTTNPIFWLYSRSRDTSELADLYMAKGKQQMTKVADQIRTGSHIAFNNGEKTLAQTADHELFLYQENGDTVKIATEASQFGYQFSIEGDLVYYTTQDHKLYVVKLNDLSIHAEKLAAEVSYYHPTAELGPLYYVDLNHNLFAIDQDGTTLRMGANVVSFASTEDGQQVIYKDNAGALYLADTSELAPPKAISAEQIPIGEMQITPRAGIIAYTAQGSEESGYGPLYIYRQAVHDEMRGNLEIDKHVVRFDMTDDEGSLYYLTNNNELYEYSLAAGNKQLIAANIVDFQVNREDGILVYVREQGEAYMKSRSLPLTKLASGIDKLILGDAGTVIFRAEDHRLFYKMYNQNPQELFDVQTYAIDAGHVYYQTTDNKIQVVRLGQSKEESWLKNSGTYQRIYTGNSLIYERLLELRDVAGRWQVRDSDSHITITDTGNQRGVISLFDDEEEEAIPVKQLYSTKTSIRLLLLGEAIEEADLVFSEGNLKMMIGDQVWELE